MRIYVEEYHGYTASVYERDGRWWGRVFRPDGVSEEPAIGKLIDRTATSEKLLESMIDLIGISDKSFDSLEEAEGCAHENLQKIAHETFASEWREKC